MTGSLDGFLLIHVLHVSEVAFGDCVYITRSSVVVFSLQSIT